MDGSPIPIDFWIVVIPRNTCEKGFLGKCPGVWAVGSSLGTVINPKEICYHRMGKSVETALTMTARGSATLRG